MRIEPFQPKHMAGLAGRLNESQALPDTQCTEEFGQRIAAVGEAYTAFADDGRVMAICGAMPLWANRVHLWAYLATDSGPHMLGITRGVRRFLETSGYVRVEAEVSEGFEAGHRWVRMLGFQCETPNGMAAFFPGGVRGYLYSKVNE